MIDPTREEKGSSAIWLSPAASLSRRDMLRVRLPAAAEDSAHWIRVHRTAMASRFEIALSGDDARHVEAARRSLDTADEVEQVLTIFRDTSEVSRVNATAASGPVPAGSTLFDLLERCRELHADTGGAFDVTTTPLSRCWGFLRRQGRLPAPEEVTAALSLVGMDKVALESRARTVRFARAGVELNFGSIGKGYALDRMASRLRCEGVQRALLSAAGSSVLSVGSGASGWPIRLRSPRSPGQGLALLRLHQGALATSGAGEQFFELHGRRYGHVIDPRTGWPAAGVLSVSVVAADAAGADALSTAFLVGGPALAEAYCTRHPGVLAVMTLEEDAGRPLLFGAHPGVQVEVAA
jgi:thiamine biosynthesis lipoprotein